MSSDFRVKFYGCRGSLAVAGKDYVRYGGATSCVVVSAGGREIVLDAGSGLTAYGAQLKKADPRVYLFLSHVHFDHIIGLPYFSPIYRPDATVNIWGPRNSRYGSIGETMAALIGPPFHPVPLWEMASKKTFRNFGAQDVVYFLKGQEEPVMFRPSHPDDRANLPSPDEIDIEVHCLRGYNHPKSGVNFYKVIADGKSVVYATDTEGFVAGDRRLIKFSEGTDLLIHDAMYTEERYVSMPVPTQGFGHSTVEIATALAHEANVKRLLLFHHDPTSTDDYLDSIEKLGSSLFENSIIGKDGLEIEL